MNMNNKKKKRGLREAARDLAERAKKMCSEEKKPQEQETVEETAAENNAAEEKTPTIEELTEALAKAQAQCDEYIDLAQRKQAEFANYRRRTEGVRKEAYDDGRCDVIKKLLPVLDNMERALAAAGEEDSPLKSGVQMVLRTMTDTLTKEGVEIIDPLGQPFDANLHEAIMQGTSDEGEPGTCCMVLQKGYSLGGKVVRPALVKVVAE